ncbi:MAG: TIGR02757 family protein [Campylobacter sp.]|nr:TIGR02757 family protein [Campylobacter sp.]
MDLKSLLEAHVLAKNTDIGLFTAADPLQVASKFKEPNIALICALFAYGNAKLIVKFLNSLDFSLLGGSEQNIVKNLENFKYRFQNCEDVRQIFITFFRLKKEAGIEELIKKGFEKNGLMNEGINELIKFIYSLNSYRSDGYEFFFGRPYEKSPSSPYKRYNMFLRWMVRDTDIDLGIFKNLPKSKLLMPLDVHTHKVSLSLGLIKRKSYDFGAVSELTQKLLEFDPNDPIKYDFALYRIGQSGELESVLKSLKL